MFREILYGNWRAKLLLIYCLDRLVLIKVSNIKLEVKYYLASFHFFINSPLTTPALLPEPSLFIRISALFFLSSPGAMMFVSSFLPCHIGNPTGNFCPSVPTKIFWTKQAELYRSSLFFKKQFWKSATVHWWFYIYRFYMGQ